MLILTASLSGLSSSGAQAAALYKWVDENGQIRYSDRLPANQAKKKHQQLNSQGVVLSTTEEAKSDEERALEAETKKKLAEQQAREAEIKKIQDEKDRVLLLTFSSEEELGLARDNRIDVLDSVIQLINKSIAGTAKKLEALQENADTNYLSKGLEVPGGLAQKIEHFTRKIENRTAQLRLKEDEKEKIMQKYDLDLTRFRLLKTETE
ncbi:MAG: DUF4124 domain-containing protein [Pseudomonadota bacterium]